MRMWMVPPKILCRKHLLGEHVEHHMLVGSLNRGKNLNGFIDTNCIEVTSVESRHDALVTEMVSRGYNHQSPLPEFTYSYLSPRVKDYKIDVPSSLEDLLSRCSECTSRAITLLRES